MVKKTADPITKSKCPITRTQFLEGAKPLALTIGNNQRIAEPKPFKTGSFGWGLNEKVVLDVNGTPVKVQASINLTIIGSKEVE